MDKKPPLSGDNLDIENHPSAVGGGYTPDREEVGEEWHGKEKKSKKDDEHDELLKFLNSVGDRLSKNDSNLKVLKSAYGSDVLPRNYRQFSKWRVNSLKKSITGLKDNE